LTMATIVLPDIDRSALADLRKRMPKLAEIELPSLEKAGKKVDHRLDQMRGRSQDPVWPWIAAGVGLVAVIGAIAAYFYWMRRPSWDTSSSGLWGEGATPLDDTLSGSDEPLDLSSTRSEAEKGLNAAESSLRSGFPLEEA
jgi:hypothetical protein